MHLTYKKEDISAGTKPELLFGAVSVLPQADLERIREHALETLANVGVRFDDSDARDALARAGANVVGDTVRISAAMVRDACARFSAPVILGAKDPSLAIRLGERRFVTTNGFGTSRVLERGGAVRPTRLDDLVFLTRLADGLEGVGYCQEQATPQDVPQDRLDVIQAIAVLGNTRKHCHLSNYSARFVDQVFEVGDIAGEGSASGLPVYSVGCCPLSPLRYSTETTILLRRAAEKGIPFLVVSGAVAGVTAPVTLAGALVVQTAEHVAALVLSQSVRAGAPIAFGSFTSPMDPRTGRQRLGAAELSLLNGATAQLCHSFGVPFGYGTGGVSDAQTIGVQSGIEKALTTLSAALAGVEVIHDAVSGILQSGLLVSAEQMAIDHELCRVVRRIVRGIDVSDETLARDAIQAAGPGGNYLTSMHTARHFRDEILVTPLLDGSAAGAEDACIAHASETVAKAVGGFAGPYLSEHQARAMANVWCSLGLEEKTVRHILSERD